MPNHKQKNCFPQMSLYSAHTHTRQLAPTCLGPGTAEHTGFPPSRPGHPGEPRRYAGPFAHGCPAVPLPLEPRRAGHGKAGPSPGMREANSPPRREEGSGPLRRRSAAAHGLGAAPNGGAEQPRRHREAAEAARRFRTRYGRRRGTRKWRALRVPCRVPQRPRRVPPVSPPCPRRVLAVSPPCPRRPSESQDGSG